MRKLNTMKHEIEIDKENSQAKITISLLLRKRGSEPKKCYGEKEARKILLEEHKDLKLGKSDNPHKFIYNFLTEKETARTWIFDIVVEKKIVSSYKKTYIKQTPKTKETKKGKKLGV